jgi:ABC-2 type transport system ATP-binding protein
MELTMHDAALTLDRVSKRFDQFCAVNEITLQIPKGSIYGFLGPNGAGKTTTIRMILEIIKPSSGSISILGHPSALQVRHRIGYLPEEKGLYKKMKAWAIIQYFAMLKGVEKKVAKQRAFELLERYGLGEFAERKVEALSKGMGQKVQVLASVAHDPELVILDEPFSGLDPVNQVVLEDLIHDMSARGQTVIFSTHVMQHAERLCDHFLLINHGKKIFDGTVHSAKASLPRRIIIETSDAIDSLRNQALILDAVVQTLPANATGAQPTTQWQLEIGEHTDPQQILQQCFELGIKLRRFEFTEPTLHDVFVHLVGNNSDSPQPSQPEEISA